VTAPVVDHLEVVQVDHQHGDRGALAFGTQKMLIREAVPGGGGEQPGFGVGAGRAFKFVDQGAAVQHSNEHEDRRKQPRTSQHEHGSDHTQQQRRNLEAECVGTGEHGLYRRGPPFEVGRGGNRHQTDKGVSEQGYQRDQGGLGAPSSDRRMARTPCRAMAA